MKVDYPPSVRTVPHVILLVKTINEVTTYMYILFHMYYHVTILLLKLQNFHRLSFLSCYQDFEEKLDERRESLENLAEQVSDLESKGYITDTEAHTVQVLSEYNQ